ncbi:autotransporter domain-containing protein [Agrobacterium sp. ST15.13.015]|uniref:autotransporter domain-containing protein n=1 Tax=Agrobacterium sp. ST15.13.015 TaxID=3017319 RepID=UPI0022C89D7A|nr:autotransporter domain-containing protein [Agrobacterium sp. ST15.13.015]MCZ7502191.1 autotransporter domain-containing protein [Rhizobium rhizogenes]
MSACFCHVLEGESRPIAGTGQEPRRKVVILDAKGLLVLLLSMVPAHVAVAETLRWTGPDGGDWFTATNWGPTQRVPNADDDAIVDSLGPAITIGNSGSIGGLSVGLGAGGNGTLVVRGSLDTKSFYLGLTDGVSGTATFSSATWSNSNLLSIGGNGTGTLVLSNGTRAASGDIHIGGFGTGNGSLTLDNSSSLSSSNTIIVGYGSGTSLATGLTGSLKVLAGSTLKSVNSVIGDDVGSHGVAIVSGADSRWVTSDEMVIGEAGVGTLTISGGGTVINRTTVIASLDSAGGSGVKVSGRGSLLQSDGGLKIGDGGAGTLLVEAAGKVKSGDAVVGFQSASSATVTGDRSSWSTDDLEIGNGTLNITAGGSVDSARARLDAAAGATGAAVVDGARSLWSVKDDMVVGENGAGSLVVTAGGRVDAGYVVLGENAGATGSIRIAGDGSILRSKSDLAVGHSGNGSAAIEAGGAVFSDDGYVGERNGSNSTVAVAGDGSRWTMTGEFFVGYDKGATGNATVSAGGDIRAANIVLGNIDGSSGALTVTGTGSTVTADSAATGSGAIYVGFGGSGSLTVTNDASLDAHNLYVASKTGADGTVLVTGVGSRATVAGGMVIGGSGTGALEVTGGASIATPTIIIAMSAGSTGVLNIGAAAGQTARSAGAVDARTISFGAGNGSIVFNHSETGYLLTADISGTGRVVAEAGVTTLSGNNSYSGGTTISSGTLRGTAGSFGSGGIANDAQLVIDGAGTLFNSISGTGTLKKTGDGNIVLTGNSTYSGVTEVSSGKLSVNGSLASMVTVGSGAVLGGSGTIGGLTVASGGTLSPGNSIGTLTSTGDVTFASGSAYAVEIDASGSSDRLDINGAITIGNNVSLVVTPLSSPSAYSLGTPYAILTATGGISGAFSSVDENFAYLIVGVTKSADNSKAYLSFNRVSPEPGLLAAATLTENARSAARAVEASGDASPLYQTAVFLQSDETQSAFSQLAGELHPSLAMALINRSQLTRDVILNRLRSAFKGIDARPILPAVERAGASDPMNIDEGSLTFWSNGFGSRGHIDGDGNGSSVSMKGGGVFFGLDGDWGDGWRTGVAAGYGRDVISQKSFLASADVDSFYAAAYAGAAIGPASLRFGAIHAFQDVETRRAVSFSTLQENLAAGYDASTTQVFAEAAWRFDFDLVQFEPYANISYVNTKTDAFGEKGGMAAVSSGSASHDQLYSTLGARFSRDIAFEGMAGQAMFDIGWRHAYGDPAVENTLFYTGGQGFSVTSAAMAQDAALINLGLRYDLNPAATLTFRYGAVFGAGMLDQSASAELGVRF